MTLEEHLADLNTKKTLLEGAIRVFGPGHPQYQIDYDLTVNNIQVSHRVLQDKLERQAHYAATTQVWIENGIHYRTLTFKITNENWQDAIDFFNKYKDEISYKFEMYIETPKSYALFTVAAVDPNILVWAKLYL